MYVGINATMKGVRATNVAAEKQWVWACTCSLLYPACKHACAILSSVACLTLQFLSTLSHKRHASFFPTIFVWNVSLQEEMSEMWPKMSTGFHVKYQSFLSDFNGNEFSEQIFDKYWNIKFHENPFSGSRVVPHGRVDRYDQAHCRFSHFSENA
jgi:hypothetical protein